ncbi:MAG TPA: hypothetical protein VIG90_13785 [Pedomonas sp.]|uniref:hypothetical protein n=1 Tax=Pedomonas sp. TaxID=2976421 RepID=UPI002F3EBD4E
MRDDQPSGEEQFQMEDPVWRALNGVRLPQDEANLPRPHPVSIKTFAIFAIGGAIAFNIFRYIIMAD